MAGLSSSYQTFGRLYSAATLTGKT